MDATSGVVRAGEEHGVFATTRWSIVLLGGKPERDQRKAQEALAELCRTYCPPIFSFVIRRGFAHEDAQDLTQDFFVKILEENWLRHANASRGRFRSFLFKSLQNFLGHELEKRRALKAGGKISFVSWEDSLEQSSSPPEAQSAAQAVHDFDVEWAAMVVAQAFRRLEEECEVSGRRRLFATLSAHLAAEREDVSYAQLARELSIAETTVKKQLHVLRQRYRALLREEVAHTVTEPAEVADEIRYLCTTLAASSA